MSLYALVANCNYGSLEHEMIRDRLVVGIRHTALSERLQLDAELTLEKAKKAVRQREAVHEQQTILSGAAGSSVDAVRPGNERGRFSNRRESHHRSSQAPNPNGIRSKRKSLSKQCLRCGKDSHSRSKCPTKDATCHNCQRKGHYSSQCRSNTSTSQESKQRSWMLRRHHREKQPGSQTFW